MKWNVILIACAMCAAILALSLSSGVWLGAVDALAPPMNYSVVAEFQELPQKDDELKKWLLSQPGVYIGFVERTGNKLSLDWGHAKTRYSDPITPDVRSEFERLGYLGLIHYQESKDYRDK